jgi:UDP-GlcNAc:undecaprenyl-phosphate/decaprenyl-phosphate GlcNAc-1-phosphate transferase
MNLLTYSISSFLLCLAAGLAGIWLAPHLGLLDHPGGRRRHGEAVPKVGGLALISSLLAFYACTSLHLITSRVETFAVLSMGLLGVVDDRFDLRARYKAGLGFFLALALALATTLKVMPGLAPFPLFGIAVPPVPWVVFALLGFMYLCIPQALNLIDGANGLATGFALVVTACLWAAGDPHPILGGALLACLVLNWPKARLFLGDCGSLFIGLLLVIYAQKAILLPRPNHMVWLFAYPAVDVITVTIIRMIHRRAIFDGDRNHLHFQLIDRWPHLSHLFVPLLLSIAAMCGSEIFTTGRWRFVPFGGLAILLGMSLTFIAASARKRPEALLKPIGEQDLAVPKPTLAPQND